MALAVVKEITGDIGMEVVRGVNVQNSDTYVSKMSTILAVFVHDETTANVAKATWSGSTVTVTCTNNDEINLLVFGIK